MFFYCVRDTKYLVVKWLQHEAEALMGKVVQLHRVLLVQGIFTVREYLVLLCKFCYAIGGTMATMSKQGLYVLLNRSRVGEAKEDSGVVHFPMGSLLHILRRKALYRLKALWKVSLFMEKNRMRSLRRDDPDRWEGEKERQTRVGIQWDRGELCTQAVFVLINWSLRS